MKTLLIGVGGAGINILKALSLEPNYAQLAINTDIESLSQSGIENTLAIQPLPFGSIGECTPPWQGATRAATASREEIEKIICNYQRLVIIAGLGGETGTGIAPYIATLGQQLNLHTLLVAILPFDFETNRLTLANQALADIKQSSIPFCVFENQSLMQTEQPLSMDEAFAQTTQRIEKVLNATLSDNLSPIYLHRQIVLDVETTGLECDSERIIEIACIELLNGKRTGNTRHWQINPKRPIQFYFHGYTNEQLADKPVFSQIALELLAFIKGAELIIHNAPFDVGFLNAELKRNRFNIHIEDICSVVDTLLLAKQKHPKQRLSLYSLCQRYGVDMGDELQHISALLKAELLTEVYLRMTALDK